MMEADTNKINTVQAKDQDPKIQTQKIQKKKIGKFIWVKNGNILAKKMKYPIPSSYRTYPILSY